MVVDGTGTREGEIVSSLLLLSDVCVGITCASGATIRSLVEFKDATSSSDSVLMLVFLRCYCCVLHS